MFENGWQKVVLIVAFLGFLAVVVDSMATIGDENLESLGHWVDGHWWEIGKTLGAALPAVATYLFGRRAGRKVAKTEVYSSAIGTAEGMETGAQVAKVLRQQARDHNLNVHA